MLVEAGEQARQIVEVGAHHVRRPFASDHGEGLFKLQQARGQLSFAIFTMITGAAASCSSLISALRNTDNNTRVCILHVWRGITLKRQHVVPVEDVVRGAVFGEIRIFHRTNTNRVSQFSSSSAGISGSFFLPPDGVTFRWSIQQIGQFHCTTRAGFERFAVFTSIMPNMWCSSGTDSGT